MRTSLTLLVATTMLYITGCSSLNDFDSLPTPQVSSLKLDLSDRQQPVVAIDYCIENHLPAEVELAGTDFKFFINELLVDASTDNLKDTVIPEQGRLCREYRMLPNTKANTKAASTIYQRMLDRTYRIDAVLNFAEKEVAPTSSTATGILKSSAAGVITGE